jgi:hypothetical protein
MRRGWERVTRPFRDDDAWIAKVFAEQEAKLAKDLALAKFDAAVRGKEPFDRDLYDTYGHPDESGSRASQLVQLEWQYYLQYPDVMTIQEFADLKMKLDYCKDL